MSFVAQRPSRATLKTTISFFVMMTFTRGIRSFSFVTKARQNKFQPVSELQSVSSNEDTTLSNDVQLYRAEGLLSVVKPLNLTSQDVVKCIRRVLESDTHRRGGTTSSPTARKNKNRIIKAGHGGTLDPLATGVLVIGIGHGTKELHSYLSGSKKYFARGEFGFETTTLDMDVSGTVTKRMPVDHITVENVRNCLPSFTGEIQQYPPIFSAIKKNGKKLYEAGREGKTAEDLQIEPRNVTVYNLELVDASLPSFDINIECGGGTYIRSLIRDIGHTLNSVATMTLLTRTQQAQFSLEDSLEKDDWTADNIYAAIEKCNKQRQAEQQKQRVDNLGTESAN